MSTLVATDQIMSFDEACQLYEYRLEDLPNLISVCDGEYRKTETCYVWFANPDRIDHE